MKTGPAGIQLVKDFEKCVLKAYLCPAGIWTIGWGNIRYANGDRVKEGDEITQEMADSELAVDLGDFERVILRNVRVPLTQNQFDALVSFVYNVGQPNFVGSTMIRLLNQGNYAWAAEQFERWSYASGKQLAGLKRRRLAEKELFLTPTTH